MTARRGALVVTIVTSLALALGGYGWADAADLVPGPLTARAPDPAPRPPVPEPVVQPPAQAVAAVPGTAGTLGPGPTAGTADGTAGVTSGGTEPAVVDAQALATELAPLLSDPALGPAPTLSVRDLATGAEVVTRSATAAREPASTAKLVTSAAALHVLGAERRLPTRVAWLAADRTASGRPALVLVGGGDLLLDAGEGSPAATDGRVGLLDLAREAVRAATEGSEPDRLLRPGTAVVDVVVDDSLLGSGPAPARDPLDAVFVSPPASLAVAAGRRGGGAGRDQDPAATAGGAFASALATALGETLGASAPATGTVEVRGAPVAAGPVLAEGRSAPLADVLAYLLVTSDNTVADAVSGLVAAERGEATTLASGGRASVEVVRDELGVDLGPTVVADGAGLEDGSLSSASALSGLLAAAAAAPPDDDLSLLPSLLPVAGLEGTLGSRFTGAERSAAGRGVVRAKTGTLTGVVALAGVGTTADGRGVSFALLGSGVPAGGTDAARVAADRVAAAVAACC